jgi:hypothetical protein
MLGLMMKRQLLLSSILTHAARSFPDVEIFSRTPDRPDHRTNYAGLLKRSSQLANALVALGVKPGDRVATLAWNGYRHLELYYGISGMGAVCHTVNPRLFVDQIVYIINHAEDRFIFFDSTFVDLVKQLMPQCPSVESWIYLGDTAEAQGAGIDGLPAYEALMAGQSDFFDWPQFDENTASGLCYTSEPPAIRRACSTAIAAGYCTRSQPPFPTPATSRLRTTSRSSRRCSMRCRGACPIAHPRWDRSSSCPARRSMAKACIDCSSRSRLHSPMACRRSGSAMCSICRLPASNRRRSNGC